MAKREYIGKTDLAVKDFDAPRIYADHELRDFHGKIQKFWEEPREVVLPNGMSGIAQKFSHQKLHVAFGAAKEVKHGIGVVFQYNERYRGFCNLWRQYEDWRRKVDWIDGKNLEGLELAAGVSF